MSYNEVHNEGTDPALCQKVLIIYIYILYIYIYIFAYFFSHSFLSSSLDSPLWNSSHLGWSTRNFPC